MRNVLMRDGTVRRMPNEEAEKAVYGGRAKRFVSNTVYRAMKLGIEVKDPGTRDPKGELRAKVKDARAKAKASQHKAEEKKKKREKERRREREAQEVLNDD